MLETGLPGRGGLSALLEGESELSLLGTGVCYLVFILVHSSAFAADSTGSIPFLVFCLFALSAMPSLRLLVLLYLVFKEICPCKASLAVPV